MSDGQPFDAIVVGTGFGGSVSAWVLAHSGLKVLILERGRRYAPGDFPRNPRSVSDGFWNPEQGQHGLFHIWQLRALEAVTASGVGGGSLIYSNVLIRKTLFPQNGAVHWPITATELDPHYAAVEAVLGGAPYPLDRPPYNETAKAVALREAARALGLRFELPKLAISFGGRPGEPIAGSNLHNADRFTCRLCGECNIGCNHGSKNTVDLNFLSQALATKKVDLRARSEVKWLRPCPGGYAVGYRSHDSSHRHDDITWVSAPMLVMAAGTLGTSYLLLRNQHYFPDISPTLGTRFSSNGDALGIVDDVRADQGRSPDPRPMKSEFGPVITATMFNPDGREGKGTVGPGFHIQDGGWPYVGAWIYEFSRLWPLGKRALRFGLRYLRGAAGFNRNTNLGADIAHLIGDTNPSTTALILLGMGYDTPGGRMWITNEGRLQAAWSAGPSEDYFNRVHAAMADVAAVHGGRLALSPLLKTFRRLITAHPLGGCPMGTTADFGVVDRDGEVFGYPGLVIADGSVMPGPIGANPSLTIAALAHRFMIRAVERRGRTFEPPA